MPEGFLPARADQTDLMISLWEHHDWVVQRWLPTDPAVVERLLASEAVPAARKAGLLTRLATDGWDGPIGRLAATLPLDTFAGRVRSVHEPVIAALVDELCARNDDLTALDVLDVLSHGYSGSLTALIDTATLLDRSGHAAA